MKDDLSSLIDTAAVRNALKHLLDWDETMLDVWFDAHRDLLRNPWTAHDGIGLVISNALCPTRIANLMLTEDQRRALSHSLGDLFDFPEYCSTNLGCVPWDDVKARLDSVLYVYGLKRGDIQPTD